MGIPVLIIGQSGSGKSYSLKNFADSEVGVFNVASKRLPFRSAIKLLNHASYGQIKQTLKANNLKTYVVDDSQYLMAFEQLNRVNEQGFKKYTDIGAHFIELIRAVEETTDDTIVYFLHHTERSDDGRLKAKTVGKLIDNWVTLEGLFTIVLYCVAEKDGHYFITQSEGLTTAKSPGEMFEIKVANDLKMVDTIIRKYYNI